MSTTTPLRASFRPVVPSGTPGRAGHPGRPRRPGAGTAAEIHKSPTHNSLSDPKLLALRRAGGAPAGQQTAARPLLGQRADADTDTRTPYHTFGICLVRFCRAPRSQNILARWCACSNPAWVTAGRRRRHLHAPRTGHARQHPLRPSFYKQQRSARTIALTGGPRRSRMHSAAQPSPRRRVRHRAPPSGGSFQALLRARPQL